jgi:transcriptional regulator with XRE-family HTH domain
VKWTPEERTRVGRRLQRLREEQGWRQEDVAKKAKIAVGTIQAIEYNKHNVTIENIAKYAAVFGVTVSQALHPDTVPSTVDPQWKDLNREHLAIARHYMRAVKAVRAAVEALLTETVPAAISDELAEEIADVVIALKTASDRIPQVAYWTLQVLERGDLLANLARRLDQDPAFEEELRALIDDPKKDKPTTK